MEVTNLMLARKPELIEKLLKTYSTNEDLREDTITQLLRPPRDESGNFKDPLNMDLTVNLTDNRSVSREILEKYLNVLGYSLLDNLEEE